MTGYEVKKVLAERGSRYGRFIDQAAISVALKRVMAASPNWQDLSPDQREALEMNAVKVSRILTGDPNYIDNWVDMSGYAQLVVNRLIEDERNFEGSTD